MAPTTLPTKANLRSFLVQLQAHQADITIWPTSQRRSLMRGGLIDLAIYGRCVASAPRLALMAISPNILVHLVRNLHAPAVNFTFDILAAKIQKEKDPTEIVQEKTRMTDMQISMHEAALVAIAHWLTALCTPHPIRLVGGSFLVDVCIRFICTHTLDAPKYVQPLTHSLVRRVKLLTLSPLEVIELVRSCRGEDDRLLVGLATAIVYKKRRGKTFQKHMDQFLALKANKILKEKVAQIEDRLLALEVNRTVKGKAD